MGKKLKTLLRLLILISVILLLALAAFVWWLTSGPRSLPFVSYYIEQSFQELDENLSVSVDSSIIKWSGITTPLALTVSDIKISDPTMKIELEIPEIKLGIDPLRAIFGRLKFNRIIILHSAIGVSTSNIAGQLEKPNTINPTNWSSGGIADLRERLIDGYEGLPFRKITIEDASFIDSESKKQLFHINKAEFEFLRHKAEIELVSNAEATISEHTMSMKSVTQFADNNIMTTVNFAEINPSYLQHIFPSGYDFTGIDLNLSGKLKLIVNDKLELQSMDVEANSDSAGTMSYGKLFPGKIPVNELKIDLTAKDSFSNFYIKNFFLSAGDEAKITAKDLLINYPSLEQAEIKGHVDIANINVPTLMELWPDTPNSANAKSWCRDSLSVGKAVSGFAEIDIKPGDLIPTALPEQDLHAEIEVQDMSVNYSPNLSYLTDAAGTLKFGGNSMTVEIKTAKDLDSIMSKGMAVIPDLAADVPVIKINGEMAGKAKDLNQFIALKPAAAGDRKLEITDGDAITDFTLELPLLETLKFSDVKINADAKLNNIAVPGIYDGIDLSSGSLDVSYSPEKLDIGGTAALNGATTKTKYTEDYKDGKTVSTIELEGTFPKSEISKFISNNLDFLKGDVPMQIKLIMGDEQNLDVKADLKENEISLPEYGYKKENGKELNLAFTLTGDSKKYEGKLSLTGDLRADGILEFSNGYTINSADFHNIGYGKNNFDMKYALVADKKYHIDISGKTIDFGPVIDNAKNSESEKATDISYEITVKTQEALLKNDVKMKNLAGNINCLPEYCTDGRFVASQGDGKIFLFDMKRDEKEKQNSKVTLHSEDAGALIKGAGIFPNVSGGLLQINSYISRNHNNSINEGSLNITNYSINHAPILAKIVTLASFTGILDTLNGAGISFKKMTVNFIKENDLLKINGGKAYGSELGLTADGFIDLKKLDININGVVVPAYSVNSILGDVPVIGNALVGGQGQGVLAVNYGVSGNYNDPKVSVNPLSLLTPGFLRGLFDIFDEKKEMPKVENKNIPPANPDTAPAVTTEPQPAPTAPAVTKSPTAPAVPDNTETPAPAASAAEPEPAAKPASQ